jgi:hypothetical protein
MGLRREYLFEKEENEIEPEDGEDDFQILFT